VATHIADIPRPMYAYVNTAYLYDHHPDHIASWQECLIYGISAIPSRAWGLSILMNNGAMVQHLPPQAVSLQGHSQAGELDHYHALPDLQVWSCYGYDFAVHEYDALSELRCRVYLGDGTWEPGRYWFTAAPYGDHYARTPDQHKHFNFVWLECGALAALPGNRMLMSDPSFTHLPPEGVRPDYRVNTRYWYPEDPWLKFDKTITEVTG